MNEEGVSRSGAPGALDAATAALVRLAAAVAEGHVPELQQRLTAAQSAGVPPLWIDELLLQSMLVVGYPLALVAFGVWREVGGPAGARGHAGEPLAHQGRQELVGPRLDPELRRRAWEQWEDVRRRKR